MNVTRDFPNRPDSVTEARRLVRRALAESAPKSGDAGDPGDAAEVVEVVEVMVSELATNCVCHTETPFTVRIDVTDHHIRVEVSDTGAGRPTLRSPKPIAPSGRGLRIVEALCDDWGVTSLPRGKTVWFTLDTSGRRRVAARPGT
jgi:anti-sigma regulatory factor (Ser/Thr protein kinase)